MPEAVWSSLIVLAVVGGLFAYCVVSGAAPLGPIWWVYRKDNPAGFWTLTAFYGLVTALVLLLTLPGIWTAYVAPLFH